MVNHPMSTRLCLTLAAAAVLMTMTLRTASGAGDEFFTVRTDGVQRVDLGGDGTVDAEFSMFALGGDGAAWGCAVIRHDDVQLVAVFDLGDLDPGPGSLATATLLGEVHTVDSHPQEVLDLVAAATGDLFQGGLVQFSFQLSNGVQFSFEAAGAVQLMQRPKTRR